MTFHWIGGPNNGGTSRALFPTCAQSTQWGLGAFLRSRSDDEGSEDVSETSALIAVLLKRGYVEGGFEEDPRREFSPRDPRVTGK
jgi:hypothetical protein